MSENSTLSADELLRLFLNEQSETESAKILELLVEKYALPMVETILRAKFSAAKKEANFSEQDYEDLRGECFLRIVSVMRARKTALETIPPIKDLAAYNAAVIYNVWNAFVREQSPNRENLKNKIRYSLDKDIRFIVEADDENGKFYRLQDQNSKSSAISVEILTSLVKDKNGFFAPADLPDLLHLIFEKADGSLKLEDLVKIVADLWQVRDMPAVSLDDLYRRASPEIIRKDNFEMQGKLEYVWGEIRALPILQRVALLYNLRDENGGEMLYTFFNTGLAALDELAEAMNLTKAQFALLLPLLPFDDKQIAAVMNLTVSRS
jgi:hypothetical protein